MPRNLSVYPDDFPSLVVQGSGDSATLTIESTVERIEISGRDAALRQALTRKMMARAAISSQNATTRILNSLMPRRLVGANQSSVPVLGTAIYMPASQGVQIFPFSNETFSYLLKRLPSVSNYNAAVGDLESGKFAGGFKFNTLVFHQSIDKYKYYSQQITGAIARLSEPRVAAIGGIGTLQQGLILGGANSSVVLRADCHVYNHATDAVSVVASYTSTPRYAPNGAISSKYAGYLIGGLSRYCAGTLLKSIEKINYTTNLNAVSAVSVAGSVPHSHVVHAAFTSDAKGYLAGGSNYVKGTDRFPVFTWASSDITGFTYANEQAALIAAKLPYPISCGVGGGSSDAGYITQALINTELATPIQGVFKMRYADEQLILIESKLPESTWDVCPTSDYSPAFY